MKQKNNNPYVPFRAKIKQARGTQCDVKLFSVIPERRIYFIPGQFFMVGRWGAGEVPISVTSARESQRHIEFAIKKAGSVTSALHSLKRGDVLWLRGPYGNGFHAADARGKDVIFVAGGIGIIPLRPLIYSVLKHKRQYKRFFLFYGSRNPSEILFKEDLRRWRKNGVTVILTVDESDQNWKGNVGLVTEHLDKIKAKFQKTCAYVCGPEIMIKNTMRELSLMGIPDSHILTTLEARMKCGIGKCGQCYHGTEYICTNGPVFTYEEIKERKVYGP
jgi:NAD(P)H-flavin reductase